MSYARWIWVGLLGLVALSFLSQIIFLGNTELAAPAQLSSEKVPSPNTELAAPAQLSSEKVPSPKLSFDLRHVGEGVPEVGIFFHTIRQKQPVSSAVPPHLTSGIAPSSWNDPIKPAASPLVVPISAAYDSRWTSERILAFSFVHQDLYKLGDGAVTACFLGNVEGRPTFMELKVFQWYQNSGRIPLYTHIAMVTICTFAAHTSSWDLSDQLTLHFAAPHGNSTTSASYAVHDPRVKSKQYPVTLGIVVTGLRAMPPLFEYFVHHQKNVMKADKMYVYLVGPVTPRCAALIKREVELGFMHIFDWRSYQLFDGFIYDYGSHIMHTHSLYTLMHTVKFLGTFDSDDWLQSVYGASLRTLLLALPKCVNCPWGPGVKPAPSLTIQHKPDNDDAGTDYNKMPISSVSFEWVYYATTPCGTDERFSMWSAVNRYSFCRGSKRNVKTVVRPIFVVDLGPHSVMNLIDSVEVFVDPCHTWVHHLRVGTSCAPWPGKGMTQRRCQKDHVPQCTLQADGLCKESITSKLIDVADESQGDNIAAESQVEIDKYTAKKPIDD